MEISQNPNLINLSLGLKRGAYSLLIIGKEIVVSEFISRIANTRKKVSIFVSGVGEILQSKKRDL
jgi:hypothetical protein